jgi:hypothetical protein
MAQKHRRKSIGAKASAQKTTMPAAIMYGRLFYLDPE